MKKWILPYPYGKDNNFVSGGPGLSTAAAAEGRRGVRVHFDVEDAVPGNDEIVNLASIPAFVRVGDSAHELLLESEITLYPGYALLVAGSGARFVAGTARCFVINLTCWHL